MTEEEFNHYRFSVRTQVKVRGEWTGITEVWFANKEVGVKNTKSLEDIKDIEDIRY